MFSGLRQFGSFIMPLHVLVVKNKTTIERTFFAYELALVGVWCAAAWLLFTDLSTWLVPFYELGVILGQVAVGTYLLTLVPGMIQRLQIAQPIGVFLMTFRRHLGVTMFLTALLHMSFTTALPALSRGGLPMLMTPTWFGFFALLTLLPLWITSNDVAQKGMGKNWKRLHRLTYVALLLIFGHVSLMQSNWRFVAGVVLLLEVASWVVAWYRLLKKKPAVPQAPTPQGAQSNQATGDTGVSV